MADGGGTCTELIALLYSHNVPIRKRRRNHPGGGCYKPRYPAVFSHVSHSSVVPHWHTCRNPENDDLGRCIHRALSRSVLRSATQFAASLHCQPFTQPSQLLSFSALLSWYPGIQGFETEIEKHYCQSPTSIVFWPGGLPGLWYSIKSAILLDAKRGRFLEPSLDRGSCNSCLVPHFRLRYSLHRIIEGIEVCERL